MYRHHAHLLSDILDHRGTRYRVGRNRIICVGLRFGGSRHIGGIDAHVSDNIALGGHNASTLPATVNIWLRIGLGESRVGFNQVHIPLRQNFRWNNKYRKQNRIKNIYVACCIQRGGEKHELIFYSICFYGIACASMLAHSPFLTLSAANRIRYTLYFSWCTSICHPILWNSRSCIINPAFGRTNMRFAFTLSTARRSVVPHRII